ncbi:MAG TPA: hypothetical protein VM915_03320 [Verrucomicrobiae bacterium]|jgi:hypothetical protein|nr:hypothetical protein [Verrucomicrobiae bacterium]
MRIPANLVGLIACTVLAGLIGWAVYGNADEPGFAQTWLVPSAIVVFLLGCGAVYFVIALFRKRD